MQPHSAAQSARNHAPARGADRRSFLSRGTKPVRALVRLCGGTDSLAAGTMPVNHPLHAARLSVSPALTGKVVCKRDPPNTSTGTEAVGDLRRTIPGSFGGSASVKKKALAVDALVRMISDVPPKVLSSETEGLRGIPQSPPPCSHDVSRDVPALGIRTGSSPVRPAYGTRLQPGRPAQAPAPSCLTLRRPRCAEINESRIHA